MTSTEIEMKEPRKLTEKDMKRMQIPMRYWDMTASGIVAKVHAHGISPRPLVSVLKSYIDQLDEMIGSGSGIMLYGNNGRGKTGAVVWLAMQIRRRGYTVLYLESAKLKQHKIEKTPFDAVTTLWERSMDVDVLVLDDFAKGVSDSKGFMQELVDELIRTRGAHLRSTLISTNVEPAKMVKDDFLKKSTLAMMQETVAFFHVSGSDLRSKTRVELVSKLTGGADVS